MIKTTTTIKKLGQIGSTTHTYSFMHRLCRLITLPELDRGWSILQTYTARDGPRDMKIYVLRCSVMNVFVWETT